jgi:N-acetylmuramoyl-L-alanine amidase
MNCNNRRRPGLRLSRWRLVWLVAFVLCQMPGAAAYAQTRREPHSAPASMKADKSKKPPGTKSAKPPKQPKGSDKAAEPAAPAASGEPAAVQPSDSNLDPIPLPAEAGTPLPQPEPQPPANQEAGSAPVQPETVTIPSACNSAEFRVTIDVGHTEKNYGAMSARDKPEFAFNLRLARELLAKLQGAGFPRTEVVVQPGSDLRKRARDLSSRRPNLMLSLHHDSVQDKFLQTGDLEGVQRTYSTHPHARGYSIFISRDNSRREESKQFARLLGRQLRIFGLKPTMHHHENIAGENRPVFDAEAGVFFYDLLAVLRQTTAPAVLLESAVITEPDDERRAEDPAYRARITDAILAAVGQYCGATSAAASGAAATPRKKK